MTKKREIDLESSLNEIISIPECNADQDKMEYSDVFFSQIHHIRFEYYKKFDEAITLNGMEEPYQNNVQNLLELFTIQNEINKEFRDKFDVEVLNVFKTKNCI
jgi:hypothetical protein